MPTITRWFRVTHDINSDPEIWELREKFGDRAGFVWLEILSIADRNSGNAGINNPQFYSILASKCRIYAPKARAIIQWCLARGWLAELGTNSPRIAHELLANLARTTNELPQFGTSSSDIHSYLWVSKWRKYNKTRESDESLSETTPRHDFTRQPIKIKSIAPKRNKPKTPYPDDFEVDEKLQAWCAHEGVVNTLPFLEAFRDHHIAKGNTFSDWPAAFRNWIRGRNRFRDNSQPQQAEGELSEQTQRILRRGL